MPAPETLGDSATHTTMVTVEVEADPAAVTALMTDVASDPAVGTGVRRGRGRRG